jgi:hypothetical protein
LYDENGNLVGFILRCFHKVEPISFGGGFNIPVDKFSLLAPYIGFASAIMAAPIAVAVYVKHSKRKKENQ